MDLFMSIAVLLGLAALFSFINERFLRLQATIGLMLLALGMTVVLFVLKAAGIAELTGWESSLVGQLDLGQTLLTGVLCFMLFSGSAGVRVKNLARYKWTIATLAIGATILACGMIGLVLAWGLPRLGLEFSFGYAIVFGALISPTDPIAALAILKSVGLPKPLETIINVSVRSYHVSSP